MRPQRKHDREPETTPIIPRLAPGGLYGEARCGRNIQAPMREQGDQCGRNKNTTVSPRRRPLSPGLRLGACMGKACAWGLGLGGDHSASSLPSPFSLDRPRMSSRIGTSSNGNVLRNALSRYRRYGSDTLLGALDAITIVGGPTSTWVA